MRRLSTAETSLPGSEALVQKIAELMERVQRGGRMSVAELGVELSGALAELGRRAEEQVLNAAASAAPTRTTCGCGGEAHSKGFEPKEFVARYGLVTLARRRRGPRLWRSEARGRSEPGAACGAGCDMRGECGGCGRSGFPFDEAWGIPDGGYADDVREATVRLGCRLGFDEAVEEVRHLWGVAPDGSTAHRWAVAEGSRAGEQVRSEAEAHWKAYEAEAYATADGRQRPKSATPGHGVVEVDGVQALTWKPGQEPRRATAKATAVADPSVPSESPAPVPAAVAGESDSQRVAHRPPPSTLSDVPGSPMGPKGRSPRVHGREICMGVTYLDRHACLESPGRGCLLEKRYTAALNDREGFWKAFHASAAVQGVLDRETVVRLSDGGAYFIDRSEELLRDRNVVGILDIQHARQHVWETGHKLCREPKATAAWVRSRLKAVDDGKTDELLADLAAEKEQRPDPAHRKALDALIGYVERHKHLMDYPRYRAAKFPIASGAIESANKRLVSRRCKQGGMLWSERGLEAIVNLRVAMFNDGTWARLWPHTARRSGQASGGGGKAPAAAGPALAVAA